MKFNAQVEALRRTVFIQEQAVPEAEEFDALDAAARHWLALVEGEPVGTVRLAGRRLGRLAVLAPYRRRGVGAALAEAVAETARDAGLTELEAWVQTRAAPWYEKRGWEVFGPEFDDAGLPHRRARLRL